MGRVIRGIEFADSVFEPAPTAWPAPVGAPVLLFGGSFDPPHRAHVELAVAARDRLFGKSGCLVFVPAARSPHKASAPRASDEDRVEMLRLAIGGEPRCAVWTDEIDRRGEGGGGASYWVETLARACVAAGERAALRFLIGADQALAFDRWRDPGVIVALAEPAVLLRDPAPTREALRRALQMGGIDPAVWMGRVVEVGVMPGASTDARAALARGEPGAGLLDPRVLAYIRSRGLYAS